MALLPAARTPDEADLYLGLHPCERCGSRDLAWENSFVDEGGVRGCRYHGTCATCSNAREFTFAVPDPPEPRMLDIYEQVVNFGGREPSQLLDPGEWLLVAQACALASDVPPGATAQSAAFREAQESLTMAIVAMGEVLKFVPAGALAVPESAFWSSRGRAVLDREPDRFRRRRLLVVRDSYEKSLAMMSESW